MAVSLDDFLELLSCNYAVHYNVYDSMGNFVLEDKEKHTIEEENLSLARLAEHFHCTIYYFSRKFKEECGISITDDIKQQKTERAKLLLKTTLLSAKTAE